MKITRPQFAVIVQQIILYLAEHRYRGDLEIHNMTDAIDITFDHGDYGDVIHIERDGTFTIEREEYAD